MKNREDRAGSFSTGSGQFEGMCIKSCVQCCWRMNEPYTSPYLSLPWATCTIRGRAVPLAMSSTLSGDLEGQPEGRCCQTAFSRDSHHSLRIHYRQLYEVRVCNLFFFHFLYSSWSWEACLTKSLNFMFPYFSTNTNEFRYGLFSYSLLAQQNIYIYMYISIYTYKYFILKVQI